MRVSVKKVGGGVRRGSGSKNIIQYVNWCKLSKKVQKIVKTRCPINATKCIRSIFSQVRHKSQTVRIHILIRTYPTGEPATVTVSVHTTDCTCIYIHSGPYIVRVWYLSLIHI